MRLVVIKLTEKRNRQVVIVGIDPRRGQVPSLETFSDLRQTLTRRISKAQGEEMVHE